MRHWGTPWIYDKTVQIDGTDIDVVVAVSGASEISADISLRYLMSDPQLAALRRELERQMASDSQWAVVDDGDLLYRRSKRTATSVSGHITTHTREWSPWVCAEPCRCQFRASGFFTVHSPNRNIYLRLPWTQTTPCYRDIGEAANELNSLDLALVEHTPGGLFFLLRDKGSSRLPGVARTLVVENELLSRVGLVL